jgi:hypothetical protein
MLDAHPLLAIPPETEFIPKLPKALGQAPRAVDDDERRRRAIALITQHRRWPDFGLDADELRVRFDDCDPFDATEATRAFFGLYAERQGKHRWGDKTPGHVLQMPRVQHVLPEARFIHLIRDGRDVALSVIKLDWGADTITAAARRWKTSVLRGREHAPLLSDYLEVRFEDLVLNTEPILMRICEFVELDFDEAMLRHHLRAEDRLREMAHDLDAGPDRPIVSAEHRMESHRLATEPPKPERVGQWREKMTPEQRAEFEAEAGDLLADLGYEVEGPVRALSGRALR